MSKGLASSGTRQMVLPSASLAYSTSWPFTSLWVSPTIWNVRFLILCCYYCFYVVCCQVTKVRFFGETTKHSCLNFLKEGEEKPRGLTGLTVNSCFLHGPPRVPYYIIIYIYTYFYISVWMEVCIFGVLTVNLLTFSSQSAPLPSERPLSRCLLKKTG